jgi:phosphoenolpyruvate carboxykinase (ATP)
MPLHPDVYANMLGERISAHNTKVFLVNTGWTGGPYGIGSRMELKYTRATITAALNGDLNYVGYKHNSRFNVEVPQSCPGVPSNILNPRDTWANKKSYDAMAIKVARMFYNNFMEKYPDMPKEITNAGPRP